MRYRTRKWKKKEDSLLLTYTETILAWWEEEQGEKIHFIQWVFGMLKKWLTKISQEQITLLKVSTLRSVNSSITCKHPNVWKLIASLKKEEALQQTKIIHVNRSDTLDSKKKRFTKVSIVN